MVTGSAVYRLCSRDTPLQLHPLLTQSQPTSPLLLRAVTRKCTRIQVLVLLLFLQDLWLRRLAGLLHHMWVTSWCPAVDLRRPLDRHLRRSRGTRCHCLPHCRLVLPLLPAVDRHCLRCLSRPRIQQHQQHQHHRRLCLRPDPAMPPPHP